MQFNLEISLALVVLEYVHAMFQCFSDTSDHGTHAAADDGDVRAVSTPSGSFESCLLSSLS